MPASAPVSEMALPPSALIAMAVSAIAACSPVASNTSISRSSGRGDSFARELDQIVGHARHRGDDGDDPAAFALRFEQFARDIADALGRTDRGAAVFLDDQAHGEPARLVAKIKQPMVSLMALSTLLKIRSRENSTR